MPETRVTSSNIKDGTIVNADISSTAAIELSKLSDSGAASGQVIVFDGVEWIPADQTGGGVSQAYVDSHLGGRDLDDTIVPASGQVYAYDGAFFVPVDMGGGVTAHGDLTGLDADDHTQYSLVDGTRSFTGKVTIDQNANAAGFLIDSDATSATPFQITADNTSGKVMDISVTAGGASNVNIVDINNSNANATTGDCISIHNHGVANRGIYVNTDADSSSLYLDSDATTKAVFNVDSSSTTASTIRVINIGVASAGATMTIGENHASSTRPCIQTYQKGTGDGIFIDTDANGIALNIDCEATTANAINLDAANTSGDVIDINTTAIAGGDIIDIDGGGLNTGRCLNVNASSLTTGNMVEVSSVASATTSGRGFYCELYSDASTQADKSGEWVYIDTYKEEKRTSGTTADDFDVFRLRRNDKQNGAGGTHTCAGSVLKLERATTQTAGTLTDSVVSLEISQSSYSVSNVYAVQVTNDVTGGGTPGGIDMSSFSTAEPLINIPVDTTLAAGTLYGKMAVYVTGIGVKYIPVYTTNVQAGSNSTRRKTFDPGSSVLPASAYAELIQNDGTNKSWFEARFDDGASVQDEKIYFNFEMDDNYDSGNVTVNIWWKAAATSGNVLWSVGMHSATEGEAFDTALTYHDAAADTVQGTTERTNVTSVTFDPGSGEADAGEAMTLGIKRKTSDAADTMAGDAKVFAITLEYSVS